MTAPTTTEGLLGALQDLQNKAKEKLSRIDSLQGCLDFRTEYLSKSGALTSVLKSMGAVSAQDRPKIGAQANTIKVEIEQKLLDVESRLKSAEDEKKMASEWVDVSLPGRVRSLGSLHALTQVMDEVVSIFARMGFTVAAGPEVEDEFYNFEALNIPEAHPSRDMQDTFYVDEGIVLRTHTSPVQARTMLSQNPPIRILSPGRVFRSDYDMTHSPMFHQVEGLMVDEVVSFADLKGILQYFSTCFFGPQAVLRFRPSFFPFTEPSAEVDVRCVFCEGYGCRSCKNSGWLEIAGCGMVDPAVFDSVGYDPLKWSGFAFGMGVERMAMLKFGVPDLRSFFENDVRTLHQFRTLRWKLWSERLRATPEVNESTKEAKKNHKQKGKS